MIFSLPQSASQPALNTLLSLRDISPDRGITRQREPPICGCFGQAMLVHTNKASSHLGEQKRGELCSPLAFNQKSTSVSGISGFEDSVKTVSSTVNESISTSGDTYSFFISSTSLNIYGWSIFRSIECIINALEIIFELIRDIAVE